MGRWLDAIPKGTKFRRCDWVRYDNHSLQAGLLEGWDQERCYLMLTARGDQPLILAMQTDEAAAICRILGTVLMELAVGEVQDV